MKLPTPTASQPHLATLIDILPIDLRIPPLQHLPVQLRAALAQNRGSPLPVLDQRQFHAAAHGLCDAELSAEKAHFEAVLLLFPGAEARFERVRGGGLGCAGVGGRGRAEVQVVAEGVVHAGGGGGAGAGGGGGCGVALGDDAEGLWEREGLVGFFL